MTSFDPDIDSGAQAELAAQYTEQVTAFAATGNSAALEAAYDIGRNALSIGLSLVDISAIHYSTLIRQNGEQPLDRTSFLRFETFYLEFLTIYDMAQRGYRTSLVKLRQKMAERERVEQDLRFATNELARQRDALDAEVIARTRQIEAVAEDLRRTNARLVDASCEQAEFTYSISHDMKSPTNTIWMLLDALREDHEDELSPDALDLLDSARETVQRMGRLTEDVLEYSRTIEEEIAPAPVDLGQLCRGIVKDLGADINKVGAQIVIRDLPVVVGSALQLRMLFQNLLSNAIKFRSTERQARIEVALRRGSPPVRRASSCWITASASGLNITNGSSACSSVCTTAKNTRAAALA